MFLFISVFNNLDSYLIFSYYLLSPKFFIPLLGTLFEFSIDFFGLIILFLDYFIRILLLLVLDNRIFFRNIKYLFSLNFFIIIVYFYVFSTNLLLFFLFYELLLIPSFLIVYFVSPSRRAVQASLYFLI